jgi:cell division septation protein DedD
MEYCALPGRSPGKGWLRASAIPVTILLALLLIAVPAAARTGSIQKIDNGDTIFLYEENLDISALRFAANPVTLLRKFVDDNPGKAMIQEITVSDDTSFTVYASSVGEELGIYYGYNPTDGNTGKYIRINEPEVEIDAVLANPYHAESIEGLNIPDTTPIAFKISAPGVASYYRYGTVYPATVDIVVTTPGGAELTTFQGRDFRGLNISSPEFYTDDPGRPGAFIFEGLEAGTYRAQAKWRTPATFDNQAPDSNTLSWNIGGTPTPTTTPTSSPPTATPTTPPTTSVTTTLTQTVTTTTEATTAPPVTTPATTPATTEPAATPTALEPVLALGAVALLALALGRKFP